MVFSPKISFSSSAFPYTNVSDFRAYSYPYAAYSPYAYPSALNLAAYPNTLSTTLSPDLFQDFSHLVVNPADLPIIPDDVFEIPKQPDNKLHNVNSGNSFSYHTSNEDLLGNETSSGYFSFPTSMSRNFLNPLFTSPLNSQYILPDGRIGELQTIPSMKGNDIISNKEANKVIYEAKKARGDKIITDILGREFTPDTVFNTKDSQDYVDESFGGQINEFLQYNGQNPNTKSQDTNIVSRLYNLYSQNSEFNNSFSGFPSGDFLSDILQSNTGLESPLMRTGNPMFDSQLSILNNPNKPLQKIVPLQQINNPTPKLSELNLLNISIEELWNSLERNNYKFSNPSEIRVNASDLKPLSTLTPTPTYKNSQILNSNIDTNDNNFSPRYNPLAYPFNVSKKDKYQGTILGEFYHNMEYLNKSFDEITKIKVPLLGSEFVQSAFNPFTERYAWTDKSPYYQDYLKTHVLGTHGGVHDVFTPRGFQPNDILSNRDSVFL
jgi:hypothetical protein